ncbi:hypothetical protein K435DRAFT_798677 [Dendrothele bispora CBS 962.96]|uniref:G-protein coupled receptors family 1 profile domain-containing protein n=1 Tax=Dendrothele bispora (strain CBS 962.96) TaxID=1314807 RepID=A0A4S8LY98_DENBC|nr:hypothetical protein K435DRAFT_798677 [Dendrothele bispora CBS 962.96]
MPVSQLTVIFCKRMGNTTIEESSIFNVEVALLGPFISLSLTLTVFGFYTFLFGLSTYFLLKHQFIFRRQLHLVWTTLSFVISTLGALLNVSSSVMDAVVFYDTLRTQNLDRFNIYITQDKTQTIITGLALTCFVVANCITDSVLIHRCYIVWGSRKWIILLPVLASILLNSFGLVAVGIKTKGFSNTTTEANFQLMLKGLDYTLKYFYANAALNLILTLTIAGRIWWIGIKTRTLTKYSKQSRIICNKYKAIFAISLEAGILYPLFLVIHAAITANVDVIPIPVDLTPIAIQLAGIAPTFIIVHTCLGRSITEKVVSSYNGTIPTECVDLRSDSSRLPAYTNDSGQKDSDAEVEVGNDEPVRLAA